MNSSQPCIHLNNAGKAQHQSLHPSYPGLTHWGRVTHICVGKLTIIASDNGLSPGRRQAIIWTNDGILWIGPLGTNFNEILIEIHTFSFKKMHLKISSAKWRPFCFGLNVLNREQGINPYPSDLSFSVRGWSAEGTSALTQGSGCSWQNMMKQPQYFFIPSLLYVHLPFRNIQARYPI